MEGKVPGECYKLGEIKYKKPQSQYSMYQKSGSLRLISPKYQSAASTEVRYQDPTLRCSTHLPSGMLLFSSTMPCTELPYAVSYVMSSTDLAGCYTISGTALAYGVMWSPAMTCPVLT
eukprot:2297578-Rhodomonas_salina.3